MSIIIFGASSQIGHFLLPCLQRQGEEVLAISRNIRLARDGVRWVTGRLPQDLPKLPRASAYISLGPLGDFARWLNSIAPQPGTRVIAASSMSAESKRHSVVPAERALSRHLRESEAALSKVCEQHDCPWTILRPTLIYGAGLDKSLSPIARRALRTRVFPLPAGNGLRQPVHADDIAQAVLAALDTPAAAGKILSLGGGERITAREMFARVRRSLPVTTLPLPFPGWLLGIAGHLLPQVQGPLARLESDLIADNHELEQLLHIHPRSFRPEARCWTPQK